MSRLFLALLFLALIFPVIKSEDEELVAEDEDYDMTEEPEIEMEEETEKEEPVVIEEPDYTVVDAMTNSLLFENFQDSSHFKKFWTHSASPDFAGRFKVGKGGDNPSISSELGLYVPQEAQRYAIFGETSKPFDFTTDNTFVVQYEVRMHEGLQCGGSYIKLTSQADNWKPSDITNETPYTFMFGPDKCGSTNKVHFIYRFKNPVTGEHVEHHLEGPPATVGTSDKRSHLYTLVVRSDNSYEIFIDKESKKKGSLLTDFEPPVIPPKMIDDPEDTKPEEWVDEAKIEDPEASKPEDWDEDAPRKIDDMEAEKPEGWLDDEPLEVPDPDASMPEDWDEEDDGEWEAPIVDNPKCSVGCGEWKRPQIDNPDYKGKWYPPMIDNPDYIGEWKPKQIENPAYFEEDNPYSKLDAVAGVAIDIWTMQKGIEYDNIYVGVSEDAAYELADNWNIRQQYQKKAMGSSSDSSGSDMLTKVRDFIEENTLAVGVTAAVLVLSILYFLMCGGDDLPQVEETQEPTETASDKRDPAKSKEKLESENTEK